MNSCLLTGSISLPNLMNINFDDYETSSTPNSVITDESTGSLSSLSPESYEYESSNSSSTNKKGNFSNILDGYHIYEKTLNNDGSIENVHLAIHRLTMQNVVVKIINKHRLKKTVFNNEIDILKALSHENIVRLLQYGQDEKHVFIVKEYCPNGNLKDYLNKNGPLRTNETKIIINKLMNCLDYIQERGFYHGGIRPENILMDRNDQIKLIGFNPVRIMVNGPKNHRRRNLNLKRTHYNVECWNIYTAPELLLMMMAADDNHHSTTTTIHIPSIDVWSCGVLLYYMLTKKLPISTSQQEYLKQFLLNNNQIESEIFQCLTFNDDSVLDLIKQMLKINPMDRINIKQILNHPWMLCYEIQQQQNSNKFCPDSSLSIHLEQPYGTATAANEKLDDEILSECLRLHGNEVKDIIELRHNILYKFTYQTATYWLIKQNYAHYKLQCELMMLGFGKERSSKTRIQHQQQKHSGNINNKRRMSNTISNGQNYNGTRRLLCAHQTDSNGSSSSGSCSTSPMTETIIESTNALDNWNYMDDDHIIQYRKNESANINDNSLPEKTCNIGVFHKSNSTFTTSNMQSNSIKSLDDNLIGQNGYKCDEKNISEDTTSDDYNLTLSMNKSSKKSFTRKLSFIGLTKKKLSSSNNSSKFHMDSLLPMSVSINDRHHGHQVVNLNRSLKGSLSCNNSPCKTKTVCFDLVDEDLENMANESYCKQPNLDQNKNGNEINLNKTIQTTTTTNGIGIYGCQLNKTSSSALIITCYKNKQDSIHVAEEILYKKGINFRIEKDKLRCCLSALNTVIVTFQLEFFTITQDSFVMINVKKLRGNMDDFKIICNNLTRYFQRSRRPKTLRKNSK